ncbi:MAG: hypothetical protein ACR2JJ_04075 [Sphingomicrobium sp.]
MKSKITACALVACLTLQACSSRPREFTPRLATAGGDQAEFNAAYATCQQLLVDGKLDSAGRSGSAAAGAAAGATTAAVGGTAAAAAGGYAGLAAASATIVLLPFAILGGAWGMSKMKRAKKERAIKAALEGCLHQRGYQVAGWSKAVKKPVIVQPDRAAD